MGMMKTITRQHQLTVVVGVPFHACIVAVRHPLVMSYALHQSLVDRRIIGEDQKAPGGGRRRRVEVDTGTVGVLNAR